MNKEIEIAEGDKIYFKKNKPIIVGMRQANGLKVKNLEKKYNDVVEKIEKPVMYTTKYRKREVLDEAEKRYLKAVFRPFKNKINFVIKKKTNFGYEEFIEAETSDTDILALPNFRKGTMYKGMEVDKEYTLKELGLYE